MVRKIYADYAKERGIGEITPAVMDTAAPSWAWKGVTISERARRRRAAVRIDRTLCVGFGACITEAPEAFVSTRAAVAVFVKPDAVERERIAARVRRLSRGRGLRL